MAREGEAESSTPPPAFTDANFKIPTLTAKSLQELALHRILLYFFYGFMITTSFNQYFLENVVNVNYRTVDFHYQGMSIFFMVTAWLNLTNLVFLTISVYKEWFMPWYPFFILNLVYTFTHSIWITSRYYARSPNDFPVPLGNNATSQDIERFCGYKFGISEFYYPKRDLTVHNFDMNTVFWLYNLVSCGMTVGCMYSSSKVCGKMMKQKNLNKNSVKNCLTSEQLQRFFGCWRK